MASSGLIRALETYAEQEADEMRALVESQAIGRMCTPQEGTVLELNLCSDMASFLTEVDFLIDGG